MDFGGILAGAMAGGGKAIQQNAQSQLEKQRKQALIELEQKRADQRAAATAQADAAQAAIDRQAELDRIEAEGSQERQTAAFENNLTGGSEVLNDAYDRAKSRADSQFDGAVDIASSTIEFGGEGKNQPSYNSILADNLRAEARASDDASVRESLMRQADEIAGGNSTSSSGNNDPLGIR